MPKGRIPHQSSADLTKKQLDSVQTAHGRMSLVDRVYSMVANQIQNRQLAAGHRLPSVRQLASDCGISADTVARAYDKLVANGQLESRAGSGFYVRQAARAPQGASDERERRESLLTSWKMLRVLQTDGPYFSTTGSGVLPTDWFDEGTVGGALRTVARGNQRGLASYAEPQGYLPLRQQLQAKLKELQIEVPPGQIIVTGGATEALHLITMGYVRGTGEHVLMDRPASFLLSNRFQSTGLNPIGVPRDADGPDLAALRTLCQKHKPRYYFMCSVLNNPTSSNLSPHRAFQLLRMAEEFDFMIVEDDTYGDLAPPSASITRLATLDQLQRVIYVGSFSKTLAPGLRVGFLAAKPAIIEWLTVYRAVTGIAGSVLPERVVYQLLSQGAYRHHCTQLRARLDQLRHPVAEQLRQLGCTLGPIPDAGMFLWAELPGGVQADKVAELMYQEGHIMASGSLFDGNKLSSHMRFNIAATRDSPCLPLLADTLRKLGA